MYISESKFLNLLENRIQIERVPFSDRGSRLLIYRDTRQPHALYVKLGERLTSVQPGLSTYRNRPPYITNVCLVDAEGQPLAFELTTYPTRAGLSNAGRRVRAASFRISKPSLLACRMALPLVSASTSPRTWRGTMPRAANSKRFVTAHTPRMGMLFSTASTIRRVALK